MHEGVNHRGTGSCLTGKKKRSVGGALKKMSGDGDSSNIRFSLL